MIAAADDFVCAADEVWRLQRGSEADCVFFQRMVNGGERVVDRGSRQGVWICAPSGRLLASINTRDVERVLETLEAGRAAWNALEPADRRLSDRELAPEHRWEHDCPTDGLVLERYARDLGPEGLDGEPSPHWNRDFAWFSSAEVGALIPADARVGDEHELPLLARRLARFHLVDNVRGQALPYATEELLEARLTARVAARRGDVLELELFGRTRADAKGPWRLGDNSWKPFREHAHGIETELVGRATLDLGAGRFDVFELAAVGRFHGRTENNGRRGGEPAGPVAFHLQISRSRERVAPAFVSLYDADWIRRPAQPTWRASPAECGLDGEH